MLPINKSTRATMSATLLSQAAAKLQSSESGSGPGQWDLGPWKQSKVCQIAPVQCGGRAAYIQAVTCNDLTTWVMCNPSVYGGTGQEDRKGILFGTSPEVIEDLKKVEAWAYSQTRDLQPNLDVVWKSVIRDIDTPSFQGKSLVTGKAPCHGEHANHCTYPIP